MIFDDSYYSDIRGSSSIRIRLINNIIPTLTSRPAEGIEFATFHGFSNYNFYSGGENTIEEDVERPLGCFGFFAETPKADNEGFFLEEPTISFSLGYSGTAKNIYVFVNLDEGGKIEEIDYETIVDGQEFKKESFDVSYFEDFIEISAPDGKLFENIFKIKLKRCTPNEYVNIGAIVVGDVLCVDNADVKEASIESSGDITGAKLTSEKFIVSLFGNIDKYASIQPNVALVSHLYNPQPLMYGKNITCAKMFIIGEDGITSDETGEQDITKIEATDILSVLADVFTDTNIEKLTTDAYQIYKLIDNAGQIYSGKIAIQNGLLKQQDETIAGATEISRVQINEEAYSTVLQALSFVGPYVFKTTNDVITPTKIFESELEPEFNINLFETKEKPKLKIYPNIKNATFSFTESITDDETKQKIVDETYVEIDSTNGAKIKIPAGYYIPEEDIGYVYIKTLKQIFFQDIADSDFYYTVLEGYLYINAKNEISDSQGIWIKVYANEVKSVTVSLNEQINETGEDVEFENKFVGAPHETNDLDFLKTVYKKIVLPYSYTDEYSYSIRGRFEIPIYSIVKIETSKNTCRKAIVTSHKLSYNGAYNSNMTLVAIGEPTSFLYPSNTLVPSDILYPKGGE